MTRTALTCAFLLAVAAPIVMAPAMAVPPEKKAAKGQAVTLDSAVERIQRKYNARVIRADTGEVYGRPVYVMRLLSDDGRMWTVRVDAATGAEL